jgi:hypothetical protein
MPDKLRLGTAVHDIVDRTFVHTVRLPTLIDLIRGRRMK